MKKLIAILAVAGFITSCNEAATTTDATADSIRNADSLSKVAAEAKTSLDSTANAVDSTMKAATDTAKAAAAKVVAAAKEGADKMKAGADKMVEKAKEAVKH